MHVDFVVSTPSPVSAPFPPPPSLSLWTQIVAMFVSLNFAWPVELQQLYAAMSVFNFNIQITAPEVRGLPMWAQA